MIFGVANSDVAVARNFVVGLCDWSCYGVRVQVAAGLSVNEADDVAIADKLEGVFKVELLLVAVGVEEPVVVGILVVVTGDLLLSRAFGESLDVRVEKTTAVAHVLESGARAHGDFERTVLADFGASQVGLEKRAHLGVTGTTVLEDKEVEVEGKKIDNHGDDDETKDTSTDVAGECSLFC